MALPKFSDTPIYEMIIPSTKMKVKYRPFLVKEQKVLLIAFESQDEKQILDAMINCIRSCIIDSISVKHLTTFDVEYMFVQIRTKSVGEKTTLLLPCPKCDADCETVVKLDDIQVNGVGDLPVIKINDQYNLKLKYPKYTDVLEKTVKEKDTSMMGKLYVLVRTCLDSLESEEERFAFDDEPEQEVEAFLDSLSSEVFEKIMLFTRELPALTHDIKYHCESCNESHDRTLYGIMDFFRYASPTKA